MIFELEIRVEFGDCDPAGIVFYPNFYRWFDAACWRMFESIGCPRKTMVDDYGIVGIPLVEARCRFLSPVQEGEDITVISCIDEWRRSSFTVNHAVRGRRGLAASGSEVRVWARGNPDPDRALVPLGVPEAIRSRLPARGALPD